MNIQFIQLYALTKTGSIKLTHVSFTVRISYNYNNGW